MIGAKSKIIYNHFEFHNINDITNFISLFWSVLKTDFLHKPKMFNIPNQKQIRFRVLFE